MNQPITLVLDDEQPISWNQYYSGKHWSKRNAEVKRVHMLVRSVIDPDWPAFDCLVDIEVTVYFKNNKIRLDASNIPAKLYEDGLVGHLLRNDNYACVRSMKTVTLLDRDRPRVEIEIKPI